METGNTPLIIKCANTGFSCCIFMGITVGKWLFRVLYIVNFDKILPNVIFSWNFTLNLIQLNLGYLAKIFILTYCGVSWGGWWLGVENMGILGIDAISVQLSPNICVLKYLASFFDQWYWNNRAENSCHELWCLHNIS